MKSYGSIPHWNKGQFGEDTIAFNKLDGSSMRFEWSVKKGFYKFGTKNIMINEKDENFGDGISIFLNKYSDDLNRIFRDQYSKVVSVVVFAEFYGDNSFSGHHVKSDEKDVCLFDISLYKRGMIGAYEFVDNFGHLHIPDLIYKGEYNADLITNVRNNIYGLKEGVVCKGVKKMGGTEMIWMVKIKTNEWLRKVKEKLGNNALLEELNNDKKLIELCR